MMRNLVLKLSGLGFILTILIATGCGEDEPIIPTNPLGPDIFFVSETGFLDADAEVAFGETFYVKINVSPGDNGLNAITIYEDNVQLPTSRIAEINSGAVGVNNPFAIVDTGGDGEEFEIGIIAVDMPNEVRTYEFEVADKDNPAQKDQVSITITTRGTPVTELNGILLNSAGPAGTGGLDLDTGEGTGTQAGNSAEIRDEGIDINLPQNQNWRRQISGMNGSVIRTLGSSTENFDFANITTQEEIVATFDAGDDLTLTNAGGNPVTDVVVEGDIFLVKNGDNYYLLRIDEVNEVYIGQDMPGNNDDNYVISIKK